MKNLTTALMSHFNALSAGVHNAFWLSIAGKLRKERGLQTDVPPYAVYHIISDVPSWTFSSDFSDVRIQFDLYSKLESSSEIEDMYTNLKLLFDWCELNVVGSTHLYMRRELARLTKDPQDAVWTYNVDYTIKLEKN